MARSVPSFSTIFVILLLLVVTEVMPRMVAEANNCKYESNKFHGVCLSDTNCESVCQTEGFPFGKCDGVLPRTCVCKKPC
ncbi:putative defensin, plant [Lupinus albus]|uniref:Putative defensin, plant n=1 Tax=Lupinus albus TaxID=3870 RepID=A0A6A4NGR9_LUPAL|nr:putative defensin, plant [Lupinus albus]